MIGHIFLAGIYHSSASWSGSGAALRIERGFCIGSSILTVADAVRVRILTDFTVIYPGFMHKFGHLARSGQLFFNSPVTPLQFYFLIFLRLEECE